MPYIKQARRIELDRFKLIESAENSGELNYMITKLILEYMGNKGLSYQTCNDIVGALDNAKDEFRRRVQHKYEDIKIEENSDLY